MSYKPLDEEGDLQTDEEEEQGDETPLTAALAPGESTNTADADVKFLKKPGKGFVIVRYTLAVGAFVLLFAFLAAAITLVALSPSCSAVPNDGLVWWKTTVIYQCYPRSFKDSDGDGSGDLVGILNKLDYLHDAGINAIWLNPIFKSPQKDNGYDVSNYMDIDPLFGTMGNLTALIEELHSRGMHLILDFVPNHTSDEHAWFVESRKSLDNPKRNWYVWANASDDGGPPNNWFSLFGGPAWTYDNTTGQYYLHQFSEFQPDLNYHNVEVQGAMEDVINFWFDLGVDGFRIDAVIYLLEDPNLGDEAPDPTFNHTGIDCSPDSNDTRCYASLIHNRTKDYPGIHSIIKNWRKIADNYTDRFLVGETTDPVDVVMTYYGQNNDEFHFPFNFLLLFNTNWTGTAVSEIVYNWTSAMPEGAWPNWVLGNHDNPRIANQAGNYLARALNILLLTLPGTPTTYYGEEIFMTDVTVPPDKRQDKYEGRDEERTPMQWDTSDNAGFTESGVTPWLPVATNYTTYNVEVESANSSSMLSLYKRTLNLTTLNEAFRFAEYEEVLNNTDIFAYRRFHNGTKNEFIVIVNFSPSSSTVDLSHMQDDFQGSKVELSTAVGSNEEGRRVDLSNEISLAGGEAMILSGYNENSGHGSSCS